MITYINVRIERGLVVMGYGVDVGKFGMMVSSYVISALLCITLYGQKTRLYTRWVCNNDTTWYVIHNLKSTVSNDVCPNGTTIYVIRNIISLIRYYKACNAQK